MDKKDLIIPFGANLNPQDSETQTYGCRQTNCNICGSNSMDGICAFVTKDNVCRKPSRAWKKKYLELKTTAQKTTY